MEQLETEIKYYLPDIKLIRRRILGLGAQSRGRLFESNYRYEDKNQSLTKQQSLLRLRRDRKATLTFKFPPPEESTEFKVLSELEVDIDDFETMHRILKKLGFHRSQIYEKWREILDLNSVEFCLDEMPYGNFIEIEGSPRDIELIVAKLDLPWNQRILMNYLQIFEILKEKLHLDFSDLTFDNFNNIELNLSDYLELLVAKA